MNRFLKDKRGFVSIYMIMWMAVLIPILLFTFIDLTHYIYESKHLKSVTDNATASAVTQIKEDLVPSGVLEIDETRAEAVALKIFKKDLLLNDDLTPKENSILKEKPMIQMHVLNITSEEGYEFETPAGVVKIYKPSVVIYAEYPVSGLFYYRSGLVLKKVSVSQVQFENNPIDGENNGNDGNNGTGETGGNEGGTGGNDGNSGSNEGNESVPVEKTYTVTTPESLEPTKEYTYVLPGLKSVKGVTSNTGNVEIVRVDGDNVTVKVSNGSVIRTVQTGGSYTPSDTKFVTEQTSAYYNKDGYVGNLQSYQVEEFASKKYVYENSEGSCPNSQYINGQSILFTHRTIEGNITTCYYSGYIFVDKYQGNVTRPESDTRTYDNYYQYKLIFEYFS